MERKQNRLHRWQDLCSKKQTTSRWNTQWQPQPTRCWTPRTTQNDGTNQEKLLVARNTQRYIKICPRMPGMSTEQGATHEESSTFTPLTHTKNTMGGNQHWCHRTPTKIRRQRCYFGSCGLIFQMIRLMATTTSISSSEVARIYRDNI